MNEIEFYCSVCGASLSARAQSAGRYCVCPECRRVTPIPVSPAPAFASYTPDLLGVEVRFRCHCCGRKLRVDCCGRKIRVDARSQGEALECSACSGPPKLPARNGSMAPAAVE